MRRFALGFAVAALIAISGDAQVAGDLDGANGPLPTIGTAVLSLPLSANGYMFKDDAGVVSHVYWNGSALTDIISNAWTMNGTVAQVAANVSPFTPGKPGAGPYTLTNYYSLGTGVDVMDFTGDRYGCAVFTTPAVTAATNRVVLSNGFFNVAGHYVYIDTTGKIHFDSGRAAAFASAAPTNLVTAVGPNVFCWWRTGTVISGKLNLGATASVDSLGNEALGSAYSANIGRYSDNSAVSFTDTIYEVIQGLGSCPGGCEAWATRQMQRTFGMLGTMNEAISVTRASPSTYEANGFIWNAPQNVLRIESSGALAESTRTNVLLSSGTVTSGTALNANWSSVGTPTYSTQGAAPDGVGTWGRVTSTANTDIIYQVRTIASTSTLAGSVWARSDTGTDTVSAQVSCQSGTLSSCTCSRSDGGACTARPGVTLAYHCTADFTISTTPVRLLVSATCSGAVTSVAFAFSPGSYTASTGSADFALAQLEGGGYHTSYIPTTSAAVTRNADVASVALPPLPSGNWTVVGDFRPYLSRAWNQPAGTIQAMWHVGTYTAANSAFFWQDTGSVFAATYDASAAFRYTSFLASSLTASTTYRLAYANAAGVMRAFRDGTDVSGSQVGAGNGLWSASPTILYVGNDSTAARAWDGYVKNLKLCRSSVLARCK